MGLFDGLKEGTIYGQQDGLQTGNVSGLFAEANPITTDPNAMSFINAAGLANKKQRQAINYLVIALKANNLWSKMKAVYPMVGGTAYSCKFNLVNPVDSDAAFRLTFIPPIFSNQGLKWNGSTQYANTFITASSVLAAADNHIAYYSRENINIASGDQKDMGATDGSTKFCVLTCGRPLDGNAFTEIGDGDKLIAGLSKAGFFIGTRTGTGTNIFFYRNGIDVGVYGAAGVATLPSSFIFIGAQSVNNSPANYTNRQCAFASIGAGLSPAQALVFSQIVQQFQIILNRAV